MAEVVAVVEEERANGRRRRLATEADMNELLDVVAVVLIVVTVCGESSTSMTGIVTSAGTKVVTKSTSWIGTMISLGVPK